MSQNDELKTLIGNVGHRVRDISSVFHRAAEWRKTDQWREGEASQEQRSTAAKRRKKNTELGEEGANEDVEEQVDGPDLRHALEAHGTARVTHAGHGGGDTLHSVPTQKQRNRDRNAERRQSLQRACDKTAKRGKWKPAHVVLHGNLQGQGEGLGDEGQRDDSPRPGDGGSGEGPQGDSRRPGAARNACLGRSAQALPHTSRESYKPQGDHLPHMEEAGGGGSQAQAGPIHAVGRGTGREKDLTSGGRTRQARPRTLWGRVCLRAKLRVETWRDSNLMRFRRQRKRQERERCRRRQQTERSIGKTVGKR